MKRARRSAMTETRWMKMRTKGGASLLGSIDESRPTFVLLSAVPRTQGRCPIAPTSLRAACCLPTFAVHPREWRAEPSVAPWVPMPASDGGIP